jgi:signal transduction histidine kinase
MRESSSSYKYLEISDKTERLVVNSVTAGGFTLVIIAVAVSFAWIFDITILKRIFSDQVTMKINTALGFLFLGSSFILISLAKLEKLSTKWGKLGSLFALLCAIIGIVSGIQYLFPFNLDFDQLIFNDFNLTSKAIPGRMAPTTAISFALMGLTLALQGSKENSPTLAQTASSITVFIGLGALVGYILGVPQLSGLGGPNMMAIHTSLSFILSGTLGLALYHDHRLIAITLSTTPAGSASRRLIPLIFIVPVCLGWIQWHYFEVGVLRGPLASAILITIYIVIMSYIVNYMSWKIHWQYSQKKETYNQLNESKELLLWREKLVTTLIHDLRSPLTSSRLTAELFCKSKKISFDRIHELGSKMIDSIDRSDRLLRNLLDSTRAAVGEIPQLTLSNFNLHDVLQLSINYVSTDRTHIELSCPKEIEGIWSRDALIRIMENLLSNAIKYGKAEGLITVMAEKRHNQEVAITVHNIGKSIPLEDQENILNYLKRSQTPTKTQGWGIGLTTVKVLTQALGGKVLVGSSKEAGTSFTIVLPIKTNSNLVKVSA